LTQPDTQTHPEEDPRKAKVDDFLQHVDRDDIRRLREMVSGLDLRKGRNTFEVQQQVLACPRQSFIAEVNYIYERE